MLLSLVTSPAERETLFGALECMPASSAKGDWALRWTTDVTASFAKRLVAFAAVEGIMFSSSFAAIFWLRSRGMLPGVCHSNELIARDEGLHTRFACTLHQHLQEQISEYDAREIIMEAVALEKSFFKGTSAPANVHHTQNLNRDV